MEKDKMIQKLANDIAFIFVERMTSDGIRYETIAEMLIDMDYRKVPEGSVVLTKEDLQKYAKDCLIGEVAGYDILQMAFARANRWREEARKQTAKEYHDKFAEVIRERDYVKGYAEIGMNEENDEILKSFGVKVEE